MLKYIKGKMNEMFFIFILIAGVQSANPYSDSEIYHEGGSFFEELKGDILSEDNIEDEEYEPLGREEVLIDPVLEDDHDDFDLYDIITLSETAIETDTDAATAEERDEIVDLHNAYRRNMTEPIVSASDMRTMEYNMTLEWSVNEWLKYCKFEHGRAATDNVTRHEQGQVLYKGGSRLFSWPIYLYYMEWPFYYYNNNTCKPGKVCSHFTQIMWGRSQHVGCARRSSCYPLTGQIISGCHYHPPGNQKPNIPMYRFGHPCTRNEIGDGNLCHKKLCVDKRMCSAYNLDCTCESKCQNCAVHNAKKCKCECKYGWDWEDCSWPCMDTFLGIRPSYRKDCFKVFRNKTCHEIATSIWCRKMCGFCSAVDPKKLPSKDKLCCDGKVCEMNYILDVETCECKKHCPSLLCLYETTTTPPKTTNAATKQPTSMANSLRQKQSPVIITMIYIIYKIFAN